MNKRTCHNCVYRYTPDSDEYREPVEWCEKKQVDLFPYPKECAEKRVELCAACNKPFDYEEWDLRHTAPDGSDIHARCCHECNHDA